MIPQRLLETLINQSLALDAKASLPLSQLRGKIVEFKMHLGNRTKTFLIQFQSSGIRFIEDDCPKDVLIEGPVSTLLKLAITKDIRKSLHRGLSFTGDVETLENLQTLFSQLDVNWEEYLSKWTGDIFAHELGNVFRAAKERRLDLYESTKESISEYLREEIKIIPTQYEINQFINEVDILRSDYERLEIKIDRLLTGKDIT